MLVMQITVSFFEKDSKFDVVLIVYFTCYTAKILLHSESYHEVVICKVDNFVYLSLVVLRVGRYLRAHSKHENLQA